MRSVPKRKASLAWDQVRAWRQCKGNGVFDVLWPAEQNLLCWESSWVINRWGFSRYRLGERWWWRNVAARLGKVQRCPRSELRLASCGLRAKVALVYLQHRKMSERLEQRFMLIYPFSFLRKQIRVVRVLPIGKVKHVSMTIQVKN